MYITAQLAQSLNLPTLGTFYQQYNNQELFSASRKVSEYAITVIILRPDQVHGLDPCAVYVVHVVVQGVRVGEDSSENISE